MQNIAEFRIIGRVGCIDTYSTVAHIDIASTYQRRLGAGGMQDTHWNRVSVIGRLLPRVAQVDRGDLVHVTARVRQNSYEHAGERIFIVELIAERLATLASSGHAAEPIDEPAADDQHRLATLSGALTGYRYLVEEFREQHDEAALAAHTLRTEQQASAVRAALDRVLASRSLVKAFVAAGYTADYLRQCHWSPDLADAVYDVRQRRSDSPHSRVND